MKNLFKTSIMRKCLVFGVVLILTLTTFPIYAFADDEPGDSSPGDRYATEEELQELDSAISETSHNLALLMASGDPVKATDYEQATYNLLSSVFGSSSSSWASIVATRLGYLSTINSSANSLVVKLTGFYNSINPDYDTTGISMYDVVHGLLTSLTTIDPDDGDLTIIETLVYIHTKLEDLESSLTAILNSTYSIDSKIVNLHNFLINFRTDMNSGFTNVLSSLSSIITNTSQIITNTANTILAINNFNNDFNNINWLDSNITYNGVTNDISDSNNIVYLSAGTYPAGDYYFSFSNYRNYDSIFRIALPIYPRYPSYLTDYIDSISFVSSSDVLYLNDYYIDYNVDNYFTYIYIFNSPYVLSPSTVTYLKIHINKSFTLADRSPLFNYILASSSDYYIVSSRIYDLKYHKILSKFENLYASDDLIEAKEDQQVYEDQAIEDFTGSGSAAASGSDLTDMKSISRSIKSGLQTGGSVNNALAPFNTNSGFWGWFSQTNYDNINNIPSTRLRSGNNNEPEIIDFYSNNQYTLQGLLNGGGN